MAVSSMVNSNILQTGTEDAGPTMAGKDRLGSDKATFLKLLVAQLSNQDPLNPTEDKEFVTQLAQFTSLEQLQEINAGVGTLNTTMTQSQLMTATGFIGKNVVAAGDQLTKFTMDGQTVTSSSWFTLDGDAAKVQATILDANGTPIASMDLGAYHSGTYQFPGWDGKTPTGQEAPNGVYTLMITAQDKNDKAVIVSQQQLTARVVGVMSEEGVYKLVLDGGRTVNLMDVTEITEPDPSEGELTTPSGQAADKAATAFLARNNAESYAESALAATAKVDAANYAERSAEMAATARQAAGDAREIADKAYENAESMKTGAAMEEYIKTDEQAKKAEGLAAQAEEFAESAKNYAEGLTG